MTHAFYMTLKVCVLLLVATVLFSDVPTTHAYFTTDQAAFSTNHKVGIFTIDFAFGSKKHDVYIPIRAMAGTSTSPEMISFEMRDETGKISAGKTVAIVLGKALIKNDFYVIPRGKNATFTLVAFYEPTDVTIHAYRLNVTHLPFSFDSTQKLQLNPSELQYYTTPQVHLGNGVLVLPSITL